MPFMDCELTSGVIKKLSDECGRIFTPDDIESIVPGLSVRVKKDVYEIAQDIEMDNPGEVSQILRTKKWHNF